MEDRMEVVEKVHIVSIVYLTPCVLPFQVFFTTYTQFPGGQKAQYTADLPAAHQFRTTAGVNLFFHKLAVLATGRCFGFGKQAQDL